MNPYQMKYQVEGEQNALTKTLAECVNFWNREDFVKKNAEGPYGNEETKKAAKTLKPEDFMLNCLLSDAKIFSKSTDPKYTSLGKIECGRGGSHVWVHINNERVFIAHF